MGGKSAGIFLDDVEVTDEMLQRILFDGCSLHAGQACILQSRLLLPERLHDDVVERLVALARERQGRRPDRSRGADGSADQRGATGPRRGARRGSARRRGEVGDRRRPAGRPGRGFYFEPTILTDVTPNSTIAQEEVFGPVLTVLRYRDDDEAVAIANNSQYGLSGAVWGADVDRAVGVARRVRTGQIAVNGCSPGDAPFGGFKQSGLGPRGRRTCRAAPVHGTEGHRGTRVTGALAGLHVVEIASEISGPYCAKLLVDLGAEVIKIEPPVRRPAARVGPISRWRGRPGSRRVCSNISTPENTVPHLISKADASRRPRAHRAGARAGRGFRARERSRDGARVRRLAAAQPKPGRRCASLTFGQSRTVRDRQATPLTLQAASGWISSRDPHRPPVQVGARIAEYVAGGYGALGALTALRLPPCGRVGEVDVSQLESLLSTLPYPMLMAERMRQARLARQPAVGAHAGGRPCRRRLGGDQLPDGPALARRVRDAGSARIRRAPARDHAGRSGARRILRQGAAVARRADRRRDRGTRSGAADSGRPGQRRRHRARLSAIPPARVLRAARRVPAGRFSARAPPFRLSKTPCGRRARRPAWEREQP